MYYETKIVPKIYLIKYQYVNKKHSVRKWTHCPFSDTKPDTFPVFEGISAAFLKIVRL